MGTFTSKNPATGEVLEELQATLPEDLPPIFARAKAAQSLWGATSLKQRRRTLFALREVLLNRVDEISSLIMKENGKPRFEAMINDLLPAVELATYLAHQSHRILKRRPLSIANPILLHRISYLEHVPLGVVAVISPWNFPFFLPFSDIMMALAAGNAVVFKPSEVTPLVGLKIKEVLEDAGFPKNLVQVVLGDGSIGAEIIHQRPEKVFFTGSVETGKKIAASAAQYLIPVNLELGGKDPMIILPDADLDYASSAALWGAFGNSGQVCASTERILVHESIAEPFLALLKEKVAALRQGPPDGPVDLGAITYERQKQIYDAQLSEAKAQGAQFICGGDFSEDRRYLRPTVVTGPHIETLSVYKEETFGPVIAVTTFRTTAEAVEKANASRYGLLASVISRSTTLAESVARQIEAGTITINEVAYTAAIPETPWGGMKDSGYGKRHAESGLLEFVHTRHIHAPRSSLFQFKSFWWYPYTPHQNDTFRIFFELYRRSWFDKIRALPIFLWNFVQMIKNERRL